VNPGKAGHPVDGRAWDEGKQRLTCDSCHEEHEPRADPEGCATCHPDPARAGGHGTATCLDCHPAHGQAPAAGPSGVNPRTRACLGCHGADAKVSEATRLRVWDHPELVFRPDGSRWTALAGLPLYSPAGEVLPDGQNGELTCSSCHLTHGPDPAEPGDSLRRPGWKEVCASCHGEESLVLYRYFHQPERREPVEGSP
jgi:hypothetical protein